MNWLVNKITRLLAREDGATAVEYAMLLFLGLLIFLSAITIFGHMTSGSFENSGGQIDAALE